MLPDSSRTVVATLAPQQLSFVFGGMSYTQSKRPSLIAADAVLCLPCEKTVMHTDQEIHILSKREFRNVIGIGFQKHVLT